MEELFDTVLVLVTFTRPDPFLTMIEMMLVLRTLGLSTLFSDSWCGVLWIFLFLFLFHPFYKLTKAVNWGKFFSPKRSSCPLNASIVYLFHQFFKRSGCTESRTFPALFWSKCLFKGFCGN
uniref:Nucleolar GTP-binding protein 2 n=1 Tax=Phakopsora pachyrhizi TaxID=170000 RepID=A0A0S1MKH3_PHAPC